jgi:hypothetical protein
LRQRRRYSFFQHGIVCRTIGCHPMMFVARHGCRWLGWFMACLRHLYLLTTLSAATQRIPARSVLKRYLPQTVCALSRGCVARLVRMGFTQSPTVMESWWIRVRALLISSRPQSGPV